MNFRAAFNAYSKRTPLWLACAMKTAKGRRDLARLLLAGGAEVNATDKMYRKTPLGEALYFGDEPVAKLLFGHGAMT